MKEVVSFVLAVSLFVVPCFAGEHSDKTSFNKKRSKFVGFSF